MAKKPLHSLKLFLAYLKPLGLFAGGLYLFGFGLYPFANPDDLLPYEQVGCLILGTCFLVWFGVSYYTLLKSLIHKKILS